MSNDVGKYLKVFAQVQNDGSRGPERLVVGLRLFNGVVGLDCRTYYLAADGKYKPSPRGFWVQAAAIEEFIMKLQEIDKHEVAEIMEAHGYSWEAEINPDMDLEIATGAQTTLVEEAPKRKRGRPRREVPAT